MTTTYTPDAYDIAYEAALAAIIRTRSAGRFDNTAVHHAVATCGITVAEVAEVGALATRAAFDTYAERQAIIAAIGEYL
jgi:non-homologous end joining protein Ku